MESALPQKRGRKQGHYLSLLSNKQRKWRNAFHVKNEKMTSKVMSITRLFLFIFPYLIFLLNYKYILLFMEITLISIKLNVTLTKKEHKFYKIQ